MRVLMTRKRAEGIRSLADDKFQRAVGKANKQYDRDHDWRAFHKAIREAGGRRDHAYSVTEKALR